jgi:hypothetical protein
MQRISGQQLHHPLIAKAESSAAQPHAVRYSRSPRPPPRYPRTHVSGPEDTTNINPECFCLSAQIRAESFAFSPS